MGWAYLVFDGRAICVLYWKRDLMGLLWRSCYAGEYVQK